MSEVRSSDPEEPPQAQGQGRRLGGATQRVVDEQAQEGLEELPTLKVRNGSGKEIPLVHGRSSGCALLEQV